MNTQNNNTELFFPLERTDPFSGDKDYYSVLQAFPTHRIFELLSTSGNTRSRMVSNSILAASSSVNLFEFDMKNEIYGVTFLLAMESFLKRGGKINIILEHSPDKYLQYFLIKLLKEFYLKNQVVLLIANQSVVQKLEIGKGDEKKTCHFMVGDETMYRFETDQNIHSFLFNFNDPILSPELDKMFKRYSENAVDYFKTLSQS